MDRRCRSSVNESPAKKIVGRRPVLACPNPNGIREWDAASSSPSNANAGIRSEYCKKRPGGHVHARVDVAIHFHDSSAKSTPDPGHNQSYITKLKFEKFHMGVV
ncbi:hypothetical protein ACLOJK_006286 [Asimina triloba]